jgi:hypothetical protein
MNIRKNMVGVAVLAAGQSGLVLADSEESFEAPTIVADLPASGSGFAHGGSVAAAADIVVVGRPFDGGSDSDGGAVDVFRRVATDATLDGVPWEWVFWCRLQPDVPMAGSRFGNSVAVDGMRVVVGGWSDDRVDVNAGAAWVFDIPETAQDVVVSTAMLVPSEQIAGDYFGWDVDIDGDVIAVGSWGVDVTEEGDHAGAVWVFEKEGADFVVSQQLTADDAMAGDRFGSAISIEGDTLLVGAPYRSDESGSVYSFRKGQAGWIQVQRVDSPEGHANEHFGSALKRVVGTGEGLGGLAVGAPGDGELGPLAGAAWAFPALGGGLFDTGESIKILIDGGGPWDRAGSSITGFESHHQDEDGDEGIILLGVPGWRNPSNGAVEGAVFVGVIDEGQLEGEGSFRLGLISADGGSLGTDVAVVQSSVPEWGFETLTLMVGAPGRLGGLGAATLVDMPRADRDGDCNGDGRFDPMEVLFDPAAHDCDGDGQHDACQLYHDDQWIDCDMDGQIDSCQIADDPSLDCDSNGRLDTCQMLDDPSHDCDIDGMLDSCQVASDPGLYDCDADGVLDGCQVANDPAQYDCDTNGVLDSCEIAADPAVVDCNGDGSLDSCQIVDDPSFYDCDSNGQLDTCDIEADPSFDCNGDGSLDSCQIVDDPSFYDCDSNGQLDSCEMAVDPTGLDCDSDGHLDSCEIASDPAIDCNADGILDSCQVASDPGLYDCDADGVLDGCQIANDPAQYDCDTNGVLDSCEIAADPAVADCNGDGMLDICTIAVNPAADCDGNGTLDECESPSFALPAYWMTERFVNGIDLGGGGGRFMPTGNALPPFWQFCTVNAGDVWIDPSSHTRIFMTDDDSVQHTLPFPFTYAGQTWNDVYVGSNGYLTFGSPDTTYIESLTSHFDRPRISGLFDDLDPSQGGQVLVGVGPGGSFVVTWWQVPEYAMPGTSNIVQIILHPNDVIEASYPALTATSAIAGLSEGGGVPPEFNSTDLSDAFDCVAHATIGGDCNENGVPDSCESSPIGDPLWGVEHFAGDFDLGYTLVRWTPTGSSVPPRWQVCSESISVLPEITTSHSYVQLYDDDSILYPIGFPFPYADTTWNDLYIGSNGYVTFGTGDVSLDPSLYAHFALPRISGFMADLNPDTGGGVFAGTSLNGAFVVTWQDVMLFNGTQDVDMQMLLHPSGIVEIAWLSSVSAEVVVGLSDLTAIPYGFAQTDLSATGSTCELLQPGDDCNGNGTLDGIEIALGCALDSDMDGIPDECQGGFLGGFVGTCTRDVTGDGAVDVHDLLRLLQVWGTVKLGGIDARCDLAPPKGDLLVNAQDLIELLQAMQDGCEQ